MSISFPGLCLGGNVFGWTSDITESFDVLDAARAAGITFVDSADVYSSWAHDGVGGQSETIIGRWMNDRGVRDEMLIATKVGMHPGLDNIRPDTVRTAAEASLERLQTDVIDLYYAHADDDGDLAESLAAFDELVTEGKVRAIGLSNFSAERIAEALAICDRDGLACPTALQPKYSLMERGYETEEREAANAARLAVIPYSTLASGFLTGKYRPGVSVDSPRAGSAGAYLEDPRGEAVLEILDVVAEAHAVPVASVALAWARLQPTIVSPIASARTVEQVEPLKLSLELELTEIELDRLDAASRVA